MVGTRVMRKVVAALLCAVVALSCAAVPALAAPEGEGGGATDALTVGVPTDRCPVFYRDVNTGEIVGIGVDLMRVAAGEAGYDVTFESIDDATLKDALDNSAYDVVMPFGSAIDSASGRPSVVSDNLIQTPFTLVTKTGIAPPQLDGLTVGMLGSLGGAAETVHQLYPGIEIVLYETMPQGVQALRTGEVDALLHNSYVWSYVLQKPSYSDLMVQPLSMFSMDFRAGALDTDAGRATIERLNEGIAALTETQRQAIVLDYTSRRLYQYDIADYLYEYGAMMVLGALLVVAVVVIVVQRQRAYRMKQEEKLRWAADHDPLTGVYSRDGFRKRVEELLRAHPDIPYLLSYNNIRDFKFVNDSLGMAAGDDLLRFWTRKSLEALSDEEAIGRIGDDHFAVLRRMGGDALMQQDEREVFEPTRNFFIDQGKDVRVQLCSGVYALTPEDYRQIDIDHMLDLARMAEKRVRHSHKEGYGFYNLDQWERGKRVADIAAHLPVAIQTGELQVWYQPQVNYATGEITGMEALCRWNHARWGWLSPAEFIPALEDSGHIHDLDCFVWERVCQDLQRWNEQGLRRSASVNVSRLDIEAGRNIAGHFSDLVQAHGLEADQLRIEITETAFTEDSALLIAVTAELRERGFQVEMDDFGSGYSSLHMLKEVQVDRIKLDLGLLSEAGDLERGRVIVGHIIQMVNDLGLGLIAEGVETAAQADFLLASGCPEMQGYHFYKPMPAEDLPNN